MSQNIFINYCGVLKQMSTKYLILLPQEEEFNFPCFEYELGIMIHFQKTETGEKEIVTLQWRIMENTFSIQWANLTLTISHMDNIFPHDMI